MSASEFNKYEKLTFEAEWIKIIKLLKRSNVDLSKIKLTSWEVDYND